MVMPSFMKPLDIADMSITAILIINTGVKDKLLFTFLSLKIKEKGESQMEDRRLTQDILLDYHNVHGKNVRIHENLEYRAKDHTLVRTGRSTRLRLGGLLPPEERESVSELPVPEEITTESQLREFARRSGFWRL